MIKFAAHNHKDEPCCSSNEDFWRDAKEPVNKEPKFPKVPRAKGARVGPEYTALHNIARRIRPIVRASLVRGINVFKNNIDLNDLAAAISEADPAKAMAAVPWDEFDGAVKGIEKAVLDGVSESAEKSKFLFRKSIHQLIPTIKPDVVFDANNPGIKNWIDKHLGELVTNIKTSTQVAIQDIMRTSINQGLPPRESAKMIRQIVGLNDRQAKAAINRRISLAKDGFKGPKLERAMERYTQKQLKYRSELIARTEAMNANNRGMLEVANQNADAGLFDRNKVTKKWIVTPYDRVCKICRPMANKEVGIDDEFVLRNDKTVPHPPAHPNCNCSWSLEIPEGAI